MTTITAPAATPTSATSSVGGPSLVGDALSMAWRNLRAMSRNPDTVVFSSIQPVIFVLMFRYVFGGAINTPGIPYVDYLMPGIFIQTVVFGATTTAVGLSTDLQTGIMERFKSLPMARSAVLSGRTMADLFRNVFVVALMTGTGFAVGFRIHTNVLAFLAALALVLLFSLAFAWVFALVGLAAKNPEGAQAASFPVLAVLVFASSAFVPVGSMPDWLQAYARHQPVSITVDAVRALCVGGPTASKVVAAVLWMVGILVVFAPLAVARYRRL